MKKMLVLLITVMLLAAAPTAPAALAQEPGILFELTEDEVDSYLAFIADGSTNWDAPGGGHKYLRPAANDGRPVYSKDPDGGIMMTNRNADWQSLDIRHEWMEQGKTYNIVVEFASEELTHFKVTNTDPPYAINLSATDAKVTEATLEYVLGSWNNTDGQRGVRLTTPADSVVSYTVRNIIIYEGITDENAAPRTWDMEIPSLYQTYSGYFRIGNIMEPALVTDEGTTAMFKYHYNAMTAENAMKPGSVSSQKDTYNFDQADRLVNWAVDNNIEAHGHTLVWHQQSAPWLTNASDGSALTRAQAKENMESFITTYVSHFTGRVSSWDVVNEVFEVSVPDHIVKWRDALRKDSPWYMAYSNGMNADAGEEPGDYIYDAFVFARLADPGAILYLNDFNEEYKGKREAIASMTEELNERWESDPRNAEPGRLLIEGLGMQAHYWTSALNVSDVRETIERFIETGARIAVTELDIPLGDWTAFSPLSDSGLERQAALYAGLFEVFVRYSDHIDKVTMWGRADHQSWRREGFPVLFDGDLQPKPAFWAVIGVVHPFQQISPGEPMPIGPDDVPGDIADGVPAETEPPAAVPPPAATEQESSGFPVWAGILLAAGITVAAGIITVIVLKRKNLTVAK